MTDRSGGMDERDVDERFASIVSQWGSPLPTADGPSPEAPADPASDAPHDGGAARSDAPESPSDPARTDPARTDPARTDPARTDPARSDAAVPDEAAAGGIHGAGPEPAADEAPRPAWVNPSPIDLGRSASSWRTAEPPPPAEDTPTTTPSVQPDDEEHFEPPEVHLPPQEDLHFWGSVIGLVAGPLMLLYVAMARPFHSTRWFVAAVVVSLIGFGLLVLRQPTHRDPTSGDDGSRI